MAHDSTPLSVHPTALVHPSSKLGRGTQVGPYAVIEEDVEVGENCRIAAHAVLKRFTRLGNRNQLHEHAVLGGTPQDLKFQEQETALTVGDDNVIREGVTLHRASSGQATRIGSGNYLMAYVHVAHDCLLGDGIIIANNVCLAGHIEIGDHAFISGGVVIHQFTRIGRRSMIGGNAKVVQDVLPYCLVDGVPARTRSLNLVGLRRAKISSAELKPLKEAYRVIFSDHSALSDRLARLSEIDSPRVRHMEEFMRDSQRGIC
ncbi:MAG TPA: acyl-ACP--UDP-N-acetylglucosamine O-acyltransferase [Acidobacteriota bacterium]|nr:acyl-ACP--UDP-N-acetylglucosamine O-acyltransferase [Acidobacteriota bacterium]